MTQRGEDGPTTHVGNAEPDEKAWYCLRAQPKHEHVAAAHLRQEKPLDIEVFCPRIRFRRRTVRGLEWVTEPLFPGYLFAKFQLARDLGLVRFARGLRGVVSFGGHVPRVGGDAIEALRAQADSSEIRVIDPAPRVGGEVQIVGGALDGLRAVVTAVLPARERVRVLLEFLGRMSEVEMGRAKVLVPVNRGGTTE